MADKTFGVKVSEDLHEKTQLMIESSGLSNKEWFAKAVALVEQNELKEGSPEHKMDLVELETHTTRIYELVANMVQRSNYLKNQTVRELQEKIEEKETTIKEFQEKAKTAIESAEELKENLSQIQQENDELKNNLSEMRLTNENNLDLINEYKEKIDTLSSLVNKYKFYADENETLKQSFSKEKSQLQSQIDELSEGNIENISIIEDLRKKLEEQERQNNFNADQLKQKMEIEKDKALLENDRKYSEKITQIQNEHTQKIKDMYDEMNNLRKEYGEKIDKLQEKIEEKENQ
ncbi:hypothetical protein DTX80_17535 [Bacilli bacterium]|uniref:hypothetical protein n=1 Tax=Oceanobacillus TaxID=182709 RepID=UPI000620EE59|nr:hypothetical protein WH51_14210 [Bacilli bacterium VT-13-104]PZD83274.1 hypothetical protein DEJ64_15510 [Bacilli bacterium]PZD84458.1 hypothetical protein DEJ60_14590 [Bacilli bacterium]PZD86674.1 hypothetical protein DEJ66_15140 [Bacilli bacterium]RCO04338.1 hypothetical protein DTX80_17535 [Bacilli bacterium]